MKQPKIKHKPNNLPYITPFSKSAQKVESMRWSVGIEAYVIHPSWPKNAIKLCKKYNTWIHQIWNYKWFNPVHLKITWILNILTIIEKHEITLGNIIGLDMTIMPWFLARFFHRDMKIDEKHGFLQLHTSLHMFCNSFLHHHTCTMSNIQTRKNKLNWYCIFPHID